jgi:hypothetical protein
MKAQEPYLGELEQQILLVILRLGDEAYANPIGEMLATAASRRVGRGASCVGGPPCKNGGM